MVSSKPFLCATTDGPDATRSVAAALADHVVDGDLLVLSGDLGAGKTCFTQGLGAGLDVEDRITSPTFTLVSTYDGRLRLNHLDVYRLDGPGDALDLDLPELAEDGVTVIEWGERIDEVLPAERLTIEFRFDDQHDDRRRLRLAFVGSSWLARCEALEVVLDRWAVPC